MSVITKAKPMDEIEALLAAGQDDVVVLGCNKCAKLSHTGGEDEVRATRESLARLGRAIRTVPGLVDAVEEGLCDPKAVRERLAPLAAEAGPAQVLVLSCGAGLKCVRDLLPGLRIVPGLDTLGPGVKGELACLSCGHCRFGEEGCAMLAVAREQAARLATGYPSR